MVRIQIQLDETTHALARQKAFAENKSLADVVRDALTRYLTSSGAQSSEVDRFTFIGSGESLPEGPSPLSERHDDALAEDYVT